MWSCPHRALCRFEVERGHVTMMALNLKGQDRFNGSAQASRLCAAWAELAIVYGRQYRP